jgi:peroxisomal enoyl-CoA hydratase 2
MVEKSIDELKDEFVGQTFTAVNRFPIEAGKIAEFAEAIKEDNPVYFDTTGETAREHGYEDVPAPPTYTMVSSFFQRRQDVGGRPDFGFDLERVLHGEQSFEYERVPVAGDVLSAEGEVVDIYQREGSRGGTMTFAEIETTYYDQDGDPVVRESSTIIETGAGEQQ